MDLKKSIKERLAHLHREEELRWFQRAKTTNILQGDNNTMYFQLMANGKHSKTRIFRLEQKEGIIDREDNLKQYITKYYKASLAVLKIYFFIGEIHDGRYSRSNFAK